MRKKSCSRVGTLAGKRLTPGTSDVIQAVLSSPENFWPFSAACLTVFLFECWRLQKIASKTRAYDFGVQFSFSCRWRGMANHLSTDDLLVAQKSTLSGVNPFLKCKGNWQAVKSPIHQGHIFPSACLKTSSVRGNNGGIVHADSPWRGGGGEEDRQTSQLLKLHKGSSNSAAPNCQVYIFLLQSSHFFKILPRKEPVISLCNPFESVLQAHGRKKDILSNNNQHWLCESAALKKVEKREGAWDTLFCTFDKMCNPCTCSGNCPFIQCKAPETQRVYLRTLT